MENIPITSVGSSGYQSADEMSLPGSESSKDDRSPLLSSMKDIQGCSDKGECVEGHLKKTFGTNSEHSVKDVAKAKTVFTTCSQMIRATVESKRPKKVYKFSEIEFHRTLMKYPQCKNLTDEKGYNLLVIIILEGRVDFLAPLLLCGILMDLVDVKVEKGTNKYSGLSANDLISRFNLRKIATELQNLKQLDESLTMLHKMARAGNEEGVCFLLHRHPQMMETPARDGSNCFMWAVTSGNLDVVKMFVEAGCDYQKLTYCGETPLGRAVHLGHHDIIYYMIEELSCDPNTKCKEDLTPVGVAISNSDLATLEVLVKCNAVIANNILPIVARTGKWELWKYICRNKHVNINQPDKNGRNSLYVAAENGFLDIVKDIVRQKASLTQFDRIRRSVLFAAIDSANLDLFNYVLKVLKSNKLLMSIINEKDTYWGKERLYSVTGRDNGILGYHFVNVRRVYMDIFAKRLRDGGPIDIAKYGEVMSSGWGTPTAECRESINKTYDIANMDLNGLPDMTPLHYALLHKQPEMALLLIQNGADVNATDQFGNQPIHLAAMRGELDVISELENCDADFGFPAEFNLTVLEIASVNRHFQIVEYIEGKNFLNERKEQMRVFIKQMTEDLNQLENQLLHKQRRRGVNVKRFIIGKCRDLQYSINSLLYDLGSTQIQQASSS